jgi:CheY-like chemotaxis protein
MAGMAETNKTILLADDSVTIQKVVELTFMDEEFRVTSVGNGAEAIAWLGENRPDVVIADVHMPGADGYEVSRRSKELHASVPVLLLVGTFETFDADAATRSGADGHLKKPFDSQDLLRRVRELASAGRVAVPAPAPAAAAPFAPELEIDEAAWEPLPDTPSPLPDLAPVDFGASAPAFDDSPLAPMAPMASSAPAFPSFELEPAPAPPRFQPVPPPVAAPTPPPAASEAFSGPLSDADVDRIARRMIDLLGDKPVRDVAWEVVPDLAEVLLKSRIRELEASVE